MSFEDELRRAAGESGLVLSPAIVGACTAHFGFLVRWNRTHNLTRITDPVDAARKHYLDCLAPLLGWPAPASFVDVGSGAGFPGLLAAAAWPSAKATLVEPAAKRASFLRLAADAMGVSVEIASPGQGSGERVLSRATFPPGEREQLAAYLLAPRETAPEETEAQEGVVAVWGHPHDLGTWEKEVSTWGPGWSAGVRAYGVAGLEPRAVLTATRGKR